MTRGATDLIHMQLIGMADEAHCIKSGSEVMRQARAEKHGLPQRTRALPHEAIPPLATNSSIVNVREPLPLSTLRIMTQQLLLKIGRPKREGH